MSDIKNKLVKGGAGWLLLGPVGGLAALLADEVGERLAKGGDEARAAREMAEIRSAALQAVARAQQEVAIAARIAAAEEVEIEEFYDTSGDGSLGLKVDNKAVTLGAAGSGRKVTRRVFRLKGLNEGYGEVLEQAFGAIKERG